MSLCWFVNLLLLMFRLFYCYFQLKYLMVHLLLCYFKLQYLVGLTVPLTMEWICCCKDSCFFFLSFS